MLARLLRNALLGKGKSTATADKDDSTPARILHITRLLDHGRNVDALEACDRALQDAPGEPSVLNCRGFALHELRRREDALASYDAALHINPNHPAALANRATTLLALNRFDDALSSLARAEALAPALAEIHYVRGNAFQEMARHEKALRSYAKALALQPNFPEARMNEGISQLSLGRFDAGWRGYEARWACAGWTSSQDAHLTRSLSTPRWSGREPLAGKSILLRAEQGLGDTIQFCRYSTMLAERGATVLLEVQPALKELLRDLRGVDFVFARGERLRRHDLHIPLLSLPLACGTRLESIPTPGAYLGDSDRHRAKVATWASRLGDRRCSRIGLAWSGNAWHRNDANRSIPFSEMLTLLDVEAEFFCLQNEVRASDRQAVQHPRLKYFGDQLADFTDTAALISNLDLVICVDTSIAHLAGALGVPTWLLLPANADFRWLLDRGDSPWYASMRLIRQRRLGSWPDAIGATRRRLVNSELAQKKPSSGR